MATFMTLIRTRGDLGEAKGVGGTRGDTGGASERVCGPIQRLVRWCAALMS